MAYTALEIVNVTLRRAGPNYRQQASLSNMTEEGKYVLNVLNLIHGRICTRRPWDWMRAVGEVQLVPTLVTDAEGSIDAAGEVTGFSSSDGDLRLSGGVSPYDYGEFWAENGSGEIYRIAEVTNTAVFSVENFVGTTGQQAMKVGQIGYDLPADFDKPLNTTSFVTGPAGLRALDPEEFFRCREYEATRRADFWVEGRPSVYTLWGRNLADTRFRLLIAPFPDVGEVLRVHYYKKPDDLTLGGYPNLPEAYHEMLINLVLEQFYAEWDVDLTKSQASELMAAIDMQRLEAEYERTTDRARVEPATGRDHYAI